MKKKNHLVMKKSITLPQKAGPHQYKKRLLVQVKHTSTRLGPRPTASKQEKTLRRNNIRHEN